MAPEKPPLMGKVALVTGAGRGLGREICLALAAAGAGLVLAGRRSEDLAELSVEFLRDGRGPVLAQSTDVGEPGEVAALAEAIAQTFGGLDIMIHAAGRGRPGRVLDAEPEEVQALLRTRLWGAWLVTRACLPLMAGRGGGDLVFFAAAGEAEPAWAMRGVVLAGAGALAEAFRRELRREARWTGVRVLTVRLAPPPVKDVTGRAAAGLRPLPNERRAQGELAEAARRIVLALTHPPEVAVKELVIHAGERGE